MTPLRLLMLPHRCPSLAFGAAAVLALAWPLVGCGQAPPHDPAKHAGAAKPTGAGDPLAEQVRQLREKVAKLEAALSQKQGPRPSMPSGGGGMGMKPMGGGKTGGGMAKSGAGGMPMMDDDSAEMAAMGGGGMGMMDEMGMGSMGGGKPGGGMGKSAGGMPMMDDDSMEMGMMGMMGMGAMGKAKGMAGMAVPSALPGFPGASHLYHVGATGFFMNHGKHIALTAAQKTTLNKIKQKALLAGATARRKIDEAEQELWALTGADEPQAEAIEAKVKSIEAIRSTQRLASIRSVGEAAKVLTDEQRAALIGTAADAPDEPAPAAKP